MDSNYHIHSFNDTVVPATCKECGYTLHKCECGYEHKDNYTPLAEHNFELVEESASTCTESGKKRYRCAVCGEEKEEFFSSGHSWGEWSIKQHSTCTEKGVQMRICSRCGQVEESDIEATGHELTSPKPSETQKGYTEYFCKNCGQTVAVPSSSQKFKNFFASHKKAVIAVSVSLVMAVVLHFASVNFFAPLYHKSRAESLTEQGEDIKAVNDSKEKRKDYKFVYDKRIDTMCNKEGNVIFSKGEYIPEYDENGNEIHFIYRGDKSEVYAEERYEYDENGNVTYRVSYDPYGIVNLENRYEYEYDENGNVIRRFIYYGRNGNVIGKDEYKYDGHGNMTYEVKYDSHGNVDWEHKYEYKYDKNGNIISEKIHSWNHRNGESDTGKIIYEYDENGKKTLETCYNENGKITLKTEFNEYEQMAQEFYYNENGEFMHRIEFEYINPRYIYRP